MGIYPELKRERTELWPIIWTAGGFCWLAVTILSLLWAWPDSGTTTKNGDYNITTTARLAHHVLLFLFSACAYRIGLSWGWPRERAARIRVLAVNVALALIVAGSGLGRVAIAEPSAPTG